MAKMLHFVSSFSGREDSCLEESEGAVLEALWLPHAARLNTINAAKRRLIRFFIVNHLYPVIFPDNITVFFKCIKASVKTCSAEPQHLA